MSGVFQNIDPTPPHRPASVYPPAFGAGGGWGANIMEDARHCSVLYIRKYFEIVQHSPLHWVARGWGVNIMEDARHCSVLYICKYFEIVQHSRHSPL
jgi:hypothetical protein